MRDFPAVFNAVSATWSVFKTIVFNILVAEEGYAFETLGIKDSHGVLHF